VVARIFKGVPEEEQVKMTRDNVCKLYGITFPAAVTVDR
jgi:hypothetical protein